MRHQRLRLGRPARPSRWPLLIVVAVPALAVLVTLLALRRGGDRAARRRTPTRQPGRRRLWWRLLLPLAGLALLAPLAGRREQHGGVNPYQVVAGVVLLLVGVSALLPWLVEAVVGRLRGGPVVLAAGHPPAAAGQRQRRPGAVSGIAVAVAGAIALQMLFAGIAGDFTTASGQDTSRAQVQVQFLRRVRPGRGAAAVRRGRGGDRRDRHPQHRGQRRLAGRPTGGDPGRRLCRAGGVRPPRPVRGRGHLPGVRSGRPGGRPAGAMLIVEDGSRWRVPTTARAAQARPARPAGCRTVCWSLPLPPPPGPRSAALDRLPPARPGRPDAVEHVRNATAAIDLTTSVSVLSPTIESPKFADIRRGLAIGTVVTLVLIATSMLVGTLEQLRERRHVLAMLVAVGTRRSTLGWSVLWQTALPVGRGRAGVGGRLRARPSALPCCGWCRPRSRSPGRWSASPSGSAR